MTQPSERSYFCSTNDSLTTKTCVQPTPGELDVILVRQIKNLQLFANVPVEVLVVLDDERQSPEDGPRERA